MLISKWYGEEMHAAMVKEMVEGMDEEMAERLHQGMGEEMHGDLLPQIQMVQEMLQKTKIKTTYPCYILLKKGKQNKP
jgi:hypothetical protein